MSSQTLDVEISNFIQRLDAFRRLDIEDDATRKALSDAARKFAFAIETSGDTIKRISFSSLENSVACVASDIDLFEILASQGKKALSTEELTAITKTDDAFLGRVLRYLASFGMIQEVSKDLWSASNITKTLSLPGNKAGLHHRQDTMMPCYQVLPRFLAETSYKNPSNGAKCPFQKAHATDLLPFRWIQDKPVQRDNFSQWIGASHEGKNNFLDVLPFEKELGSDSQPETPLFVDVGGAFGHQCANFKKRLPYTPGRVILQDLPAVVAKAPPMEGVEPMAHDFMTEQPVKGARAYYMRNIMHDHPDDTCIVILQQIIKAMGKESVILIDDMVLPNQGANWRMTQLDLNMMSTTAGAERTEKQWHSLIDTAGLNIQMLRNYTGELGDSIIVAVPKQSYEVQKSKSTGSEAFS